MMHLARYTSLPFPNVLLGSRTTKTVQVDRGLPSPIRLTVLSQHPGLVRKVKAKISMGTVRQQYQ